MTTSNPDADKDESPRLQKIEIEGLFETDNASLEFTDSNITILYGTNGAGKSTVFRIIKYMLSKEAVPLLYEPFQTATIKFSNSWELQANNEDRERTEIINGDRFELPYTYKTIEKMIQEAQGSIASNQLFIEHLKLLNIRSLSNGGFWNREKKSIVPFNEIFEMYQSFNKNKKGKYTGIILQVNEEPFKFDTLKKHEVENKDRKINIEVKLISSDRLLPIENQSSELGDPLETQAMIVTICNKLKQVILDAREITRKKSSDLDSSFLKILAMRSKTEMTALEREKNWGDLKILHERLLSCALATADQAELPAELADNVDPKVVGIFVECLLEKASGATTELAKLEVFLRILKNRLVDKDARLSAENGLEITRKENIVPLEKLSSGEQHLIVMFYNLIFETSPGGVCLIDEPEISLNVSWQTQFITDIIAVAKVSPQQYIIATHSPQIVSTHAELLRSIEVTNNNAS